MCGRYTLATTQEMIDYSFDIRLDSFEFMPRYNIAPTQEVLTVISEVVNGEGVRQARMMRWGLIPFWAKDIKIGSRMINARAETVADNRAFKNAFQKRRCLILADSFYEWKGTGKNKQPMRIMLRSEEPFAFAGIWETWWDKSRPEAEPSSSCSIITTAPNSLVEPIHDRMPVLLPRELEADWLDLENQDTGLLREILLPYDPGLMTAYEVSTLVNAAKNQGPELILPLAQRPLIEP